MKYLTIGTLWKDEDSYAKDFVAYHKAIGVERFVIFDREYNRVKELFKNDPSVDVIHFPEQEGNIHQEAWGQLIKYNQGKTKWLALIDADQCLVPVKIIDVKEILKDYEEFACIQINWKTFGSSFIQDRVPGSMYERFLLCAETNNIYNTPTQFICQPDRTLPIKTQEPHYPELPDGEISINTNKQQITNDKQNPLNPSRPKIFNEPPLHDILYVAHYTNKSKQEFLEKNAKGRADIYGMKMKLDQFEEYDAECNKAVDTRILELWKLAKIETK